MPSIPRNSHLPCFLQKCAVSQFRRRFAALENAIQYSDRPATAGPVSWPACRFQNLAPAHPRIPASAMKNFLWGSSGRGSARAGAKEM